MARRSSSRSSSRSSGESFFLAQVKSLGWMYVPEQQYPFAKEIGRKWTFDFAWPSLKLALEVEGGTWIAGRHSRGAGFARDCEKYNRATLMGWRVLRVTTEMVDDGRALRWIEEALK